jgi:hypothetical protein
LCNALDFTCHFIIIQLALILYEFITSSLYIDHSISIYCFGLLFVCPDMPVTTRSMIKCGLQPPPGSVGLLTCPTCCTDGITTTSSSTGLPLPVDSSSFVPELIDQCELSSSSSESDDSSSLLSDGSYEISKFENFELVANATTETTRHNLNYCQFSRMESDFEDPQIVSVKVDNGQASQDDIMKMLSLISNQMMGTIQDLQNRLTQNELKFTSEIQRLSAESEKFRQDILGNI